MPTAQPTAAAMPQHRSLPELPTHSAACVPAAKNARNECATCRTQPPSPALSHGARAAHARHNVHGAHTHFRDDPQDIRGELTSDAAKRSRSVALTSVLVIRDAQLYERSPPPLFEPIFTPSGTMDINVSRQLLMESPYRGARNCQHGGRICRYRQAAWHLHKSGHSDTEEPMHAHCLDESITL